MNCVIATTAHNTYDKPSSQANKTDYLAILPKRL